MDMQLVFVCIKSHWVKCASLRVQFSCTSFLLFGGMIFRTNEISDSTMDQLLPALMYIRNFRVSVVFFFVSYLLYAYKCYTFMYCLEILSYFQTEKTDHQV